MPLMSFQPGDSVVMWIEKQSRYPYLGFFSVVVWLLNRHYEERSDVAISGRLTRLPLPSATQLLAMMGNNTTIKV